MIIPPVLLAFELFIKEGFTREAKRPKAFSLLYYHRA